MRFELNNGEMSEYFTDHETGNTYWFGEHEDFCTVCELLNDLTSTDKVKFEPDCAEPEQEENSPKIFREGVFRIIDDALRKYAKEKEQISSLKHDKDDFSVDVGLAIIQAKYDSLLFIRDKISEL